MDAQTNSLADEVWASADRTFEAADRLFEAVRKSESGKKSD